MAFGDIHCFGIGRLAPGFHQRSRVFIDDLLLGLYSFPVIRGIAAGALHRFLVRIGLSPALSCFVFVFRRIKPVENVFHVHASSFGFLIEDGKRSVYGANHGFGLPDARPKLFLLSYQCFPSFKTRIIQRAPDLFERKTQFAPDKDLLQAKQIVIAVETVSSAAARLWNQKSDLVVVMQRPDRDPCDSSDLFHPVIALRLHEEECGASRGERVKRNLLVLALASMKHRTPLVSLVVLTAAFFVSSANAQLLNKQAPIVVSHYHLNVTSLEAHRKFWVDTLGGTPMKWGSSGVDVIKFPDVFLFLRVQPPTGPTRGTPFDHIGFAVPDVPKVAAKAVAAGYALTVGREPGPGQTASPPTAGNYGRFAYLIGPDGVKVELVTASDANAPPIAHHHVHFTNKQYVEMQQWYMKAFNATLRPGQTDYFIGADLPGVGYMLNFFLWEPAENLTGTDRRAVDHIGFEVRNLQEFCRKLEAKGIMLTVPYRIAPELNGIGTALITDPWGTRIELTEGLRDVN